MHDTVDERRGHDFVTEYLGKPTFAVFYAHQSSTD